MDPIVRFLKSYLLTFLLLTLSPNAYQASTPDGVRCTEVREELMWAVEDGLITIERADEIVDRCITNYS